jgi:hypothetical protein
VVAFGAAVRPLGLIIAGPLAIVMSAFASEEVRWGETLVSCCVRTCAHWQGDAEARGEREMGGLRWHARPVNA